MSKKGLAIVYDPHNLYQFVWYYCNKGKNKKWDALCLPNGSKGEYMHSYCESLEVFENIFRNDTDFSVMKPLKKAFVFFEMVLYAILGRRKKYCKKILNQYVNEADYDEIVVIADVGFVSGACASLGEEKDVIILEDGIGDYSERSKTITKNKIKSTYQWQGFILSKLGYCSPGWFWFEPDKYCIKYACQPDKLKYTNFKEIRKLYSSEGTDEDLFDRLLRKMYPSLSKVDFDSIEMVLISRPLTDYVSDDAKYRNAVEKYVSEKYSSVLVKKHPREASTYSFPDNMKIIDLDNSIPAEAILPYIRGKEIVFVTASALVMYTSSFDISCKIILFNDIYEESRKSNSMFRPQTEDDVVNLCNRFLDKGYEILRL